MPTHSRRALARRPAPFRSRVTPAAFALLLCGAILVGSCGGDGPITPLLPGERQDRDFVALSVAGGAETTYAEGSGTPAVACDPRVDWFLYQVVMYSNYTNGPGPNGYDSFFGILFPLMDGVGTYTVQGDHVEVYFYNGTRYAANRNLTTSDGTVVVTRSDDRIEGTFTVTVVDLQETTSFTLTGHFGVSAGYSASCL